MSAKILQALELLRVEPYEFVIKNWPSGATAALYVSQSDATIFCLRDVIEDEEMWPIHDHEDSHVGWHMWEHEGEYSEVNEFLKYRHLMLNDGPWIFYAFIDSPLDLAVRAAEEIVFRAEVYIRHAE